MESVGVLCGRVVAPNKDILDILNGAALSLGDDALGSILVEAGQSSEVLLGDAGGEMGCDQSVGVCRVTDNQNFDSLLCYLVKSLALSLENLSVGAQEVTALHAGAAGLSADKHSDIAVFEANKGVSGGDDGVDEVVRSVVELHDEAFQNLLSSWELDELKNHLLVGSEHSALRNEVAEEGANRSGGSGHCDTDGFVRLRGGGEVSANAL